MSEAGKQCKNALKIAANPAASKTVGSRKLRGETRADFNVPEQSPGCLQQKLTLDPPVVRKGKGGVTGKNRPARPSVAELLLRSKEPQTGTGGAGAASGEKCGEKGSQNKEVSREEIRDISNSKAIGGILSNQGQGVEGEAPPARILLMGEKGMSW